MVIMEEMEFIEIFCRNRGLTGGIRIMKIWNVPTRMGLLFHLISAMLMMSFAWAAAAAEKAEDKNPKQRETTAETVVYPLLRQNFFGDNVVETMEPHAYGNGKFTTETLDGKIVYTCDTSDNVNRDGDTNRGENVPQYGVAWSLKLAQTRPAPIYFAAESKATEVSGGPDSNYAIYADLVYTDGTPEWGVAVPFGVGTHDWQRIEKTFLPSKPVQSLTFYTLFRSHTGTARFRNPEVRLANLPDAPDFGFFDGLPVTLHFHSAQESSMDSSTEPSAETLAESAKTSQESVVAESSQQQVSPVYLRDVVAHSDWILATGVGDSLETKNTIGWQQEVLKLQIDLQHTSPLENGEYHLRLRNKSGTDRAMTLVIPMRLSPESQNIQWLPAPDQVVHIDEEDTREYSLTTGTAAGTGRLGLWPMAGLRTTEMAEITRDSQTVPTPTYCEYWAQMNPDYPAVSRIFYNAATRELCVAFDLGFSPEKAESELRFRLIKRRLPNQDASEQALLPVEWTYRAEWQKSPFYIGTERRRIADQGLWMPFAAISKVPQPEDFGFRFKEGNDETAWDDAHRVLTFRYTEPMTWWMPMQSVEKPWTLDKAIAEAERLAAAGNREALAWKTSAMYGPDGKPIAQILDTPWCNGAVWSINSMPGVTGDVTDYVNKFSSNVIESLYGPSPQTPRPFIDQAEQTTGQDGEYIDSSEGYVTRELDCRRDHFAAVQTPLTFENATQQPAIFRGLVTYEYTKSLADETHRRGKLMMANSTPSQLWWLAPKLDVLGTETNWKWGGKWQPMSLQDMIYRRALSGTNAYCYLQNTNFDAFPPELIDRYMQRSVAFGFFPGFFSADASTGHYFSRPDLFERDRPLFKKYMPIAKELTRAGWEPVPMLQIVSETEVRGANLEGETLDTASAAEPQPIHIERFGQRTADSERAANFTQPANSKLTENVVYWTLFNPNSEATSTTAFRFTKSYVPAKVDVVLGEPNRVKHEAGTPEQIRVTIPPESVVVLRATYN